MARRVGFVLLGLAAVAFVATIAVAGIERTGAGGAGCGTAASPSELVSDGPASGGCAGAFDTLAPAAVGLGLVGTALGVAGTALALRARPLVALGLAAGAIAASAAWLVGTEGNLVGRWAATLLAVAFVTVTVAVVRTQRTPLARS